MKHYLTTLLLLCTCISYAQSTDLSRHNFLYVGEFDTRKPECQSIFLVRNGKVAWSYSLPLHNSAGKIQEFDDITMTSDSVITYAAMSKVGKIKYPESTTIWEFICPEGTESHSCQPIDDDRVLIALNGVPGKLLIYNTRSDSLEREVIVPTIGTNTHGQFRHARMTKDGTITTGLYHEKKAVELDMSGNILWSADAETPWSVLKLENGNYLVSGDGHAYTREFDTKGNIIWEVTQKDVTFKLFNNQTALRCRNGNTIICNWVSGDPGNWPGTIQFFEITPQKEIVWKVSSWDNPDLGPCTYIQLLDE